MSVKIRLARAGAKKAPFYRIVVADSRSPRDGRFIEILGRYNPRTQPSTVELDVDKAKAWIAKGAETSETVAKLIEDRRDPGRGGRGSQEGGQAVEEGRGQGRGRREGEGRRQGEGRRRRQGRRGSEGRRGARRRGARRRGACRRGAAAEEAPAEEPAADESARVAGTRRGSNADTRQARPLPHHVARRRPRRRCRSRSSARARRSRTRSRWTPTTSGKVIGRQGRVIKAIRTLVARRGRGRRRRTSTSRSSASSWNRSSRWDVSSRRMDSKGRSRWLRPRTFPFCFPKACAVWFVPPRARRRAPRRSRACARARRGRS